jgi:hypothetical protein
MEENRRLYDRMKSRNISTLQLHRVLNEIDIHIPKRTLQYYLDSDMLKCKDDRVQKVADFLIKSFDETILNLKTVID